MTIIKRKKGYFSISAVAQMFSVHQQTIRFYEQEGLITPKRSAGNTRLFSQEDVNRLEEIIYLTHQLGVNLAGVEMILKLKKQMRKMQKEMNKVFEVHQIELNQEVELSKRRVSEHTASLTKLKKKSAIDAIVNTETSPSNSSAHNASAQESHKIFDANDWEIEYD
jgi:MerR family transcriptional regulator, heat shock protein HspR